MIFQISLPMKWKSKRIMIYQVETRNRSPNEQSNYHFLKRPIIQTVRYMMNWTIAGVKRSLKSVSWNKIFSDHNLLITFSLFFVFFVFFFTEIHVRLPAKVIAKHLKVNITNTSINVHSLMNGERQEIVCGQLSEKCKALDAVWTITEGNKLNISLG